MNHLDTLESQSIFILREAFAKFQNLGLLWSLGKDSNVMLWLAKKLFVETYLFHFYSAIRARNFLKCIDSKSVTLRSEFKFNRAELSTT